MEIEFITKNFKADPAKMVKNLLELKKQKKDLQGKEYKVSDFIRQYDPKGHDVLSPSKRPNKMKKKGKQEVEVPVSRLPVPFQKIIVKRAVSFLLGNPIKLDAQVEANGVGQKMADLVDKTWKDCKLDYVNKELARVLFSETEVAELWFSVDASDHQWKGTANDGKKKKLRMIILSEGNGDRLYPYWNKYGDMIAFGRGYMVVDENGKEHEHFDLYTDKQVYKYKRAQDWEFVSEAAHGFEKIPVIYYHQPWPEWFDVEEMIQRFETRLSNFADTNDYFGDPIITVNGKVTGFAEKGESGKLLQMEGDAKAQYLIWEHAPESTKLEFELLIKQIYSMSQTPDISFESVKGVDQVSGIALKLLFVDAHLKAKEKESVFGQAIQRRINFIKHAMGIINAGLTSEEGILIEPIFTPYMPEDIKEMVAILSESLGGKAIMSTESAVRHNPLVRDADVELKRMRDDQIGGMES